jgi:UDP-N-acetylmuramate dehydrogenase
MKNNIPLCVREYVPLSGETALCVGGVSRYVADITNSQELQEVLVFTQSLDLPLRILGSGTNVVVSEERFPGVTVRMCILGIEKKQEDEISIEIRVGGGESWDKFVEYAVNNGWSGVEALSLIPGTVGACPVQNIGAYGSEVSDTITEVQYVDIKTGSLHTLSNKECLFGYRDSIFKQSLRGKVIITHVVFKLSKLPPSIPDYQGVEDALHQKEISTPTIADIRNVIIEIRSKKLPDPKDTPNVGSFFKNPIIKKSTYDMLIIKYPTMPSFAVSDSDIKIPAGWLIEQSGYKGKRIGNVGMHEHNALVLVNYGNATTDQVYAFRDEIIHVVQEKFGITLEQEPVMME